MQDTLQKRGRATDYSRERMNGDTANPKRQPTRRAVTLAEVLIAMGILTIGLLGVAAIFPVGGHYMQSGDVADRGGAIAQAALDDAIIRGYLDPDNWVVHDISEGTGVFMSLTTGVNTGSAERTSLTEAASRPGMDEVDEPFALGLSTVQSARSVVFGDAYVIDPIGLASALEDTGSGQVGNAWNSSVLRHFPAFTTANGAVLYQSDAWSPWKAFSASWPVRRVTPIHALASLTTSSTIYQLQKPLAQELFSAADDLAQHFPSAGDEPVRQRWENWTPGTGDYFASARQSQGDYSWIISVAPSSAAARDTLATRPDAYPVEVSVVVFHKRTATRGLQATAEAERLVTARVATAGPSGGELLLTRRAATNTTPGEPEVSPFEDLRAGQYVMVVGPHPLSTDGRPILALRWCRVLNVEDSGEPILPNNSGTPPTLDRDEQVLVALRGPDWPWQASDDITNTNRLSNDLRVAILPGAVAVHTKTMRLEAGSEWSID